MIGRFGVAGLIGSAVLLVGYRSTSLGMPNDAGGRGADAPVPEIRGTVADREGNAIAGARVRACGAIKGRVSSASGSSVRASVTVEAVDIEPNPDMPWLRTFSRPCDDVSGTFRIDRLPPGIYALSVRSLDGVGSVVVADVRVIDGSDTDVGVIVVSEGKNDAR